WRALVTCSLPVHRGKARASRNRTLAPLPDQPKGQLHKSACYLLSRRSPRPWVRKPSAVYGATMSLAWQVTPNLAFEVTYKRASVHLNASITATGTRAPSSALIRFDWGAGQGTNFSKGPIGHLKNVRFWPKAALAVGG